MTPPTFAAFETDKRAAGFDEILERRWAPNTVLATHTHPFDVDALVIEGEMWLTHSGQTRHLRPGDRFTLAREVPHDERYGEQGAVVFAARRH